MATVIAISTAKGGTGKTTTACNLAAGLAHRIAHERKSDRVVLVDLDPQGNAGDYWGIRDRMYDERLNPDGICLSKVLTGAADATDALVEVMPNFWILPSTQALNEAMDGLVAADMAKVLKGRSATGVRNVLVERLASVTKQARFVILDCPPNPGALELPIAVYADHVIAPVPLQYLTAMGVLQFVQSLERLSDESGAKARLLYVLPTMVGRMRDGVPHELLERAMMDDLHRVFRESQIAPVVTTSARVKEGAAAHLSIFQYAPDSQQAQAYGQLVNKVYRHG